MLCPPSLPSWPLHPLNKSYKILPGANYLNGITFYPQSNGFMYYSLRCLDSMRCHWLHYGRGKGSYSLRAKFTNVYHTLEVNNNSPWFSFLIEIEKKCTCPNTVHRPELETTSLLVKLPHLSRQRQSGQPLGLQELQSSYRSRLLPAESVLGNLTGCDEAHHSFIC